MARRETNREDLLHEATALVERIELAATESPTADRVVVGFRAKAAMSIFFGGGAVYQFNTRGELRRAYCDGLLFKAVRGRLVLLQRTRQPSEVRLLRHELSEEEQARFLSQMRCRLNEFVGRLKAGRLSVVGQVPPDADVLGRVRTWFADHDPCVVARMPHVLAAGGDHCG
jgi:hypothetical protein